MSDKATTHTVPIEVTENIEHGMFLRSGIASGTDQDGREIAIDLSGTALVIQFGGWRKPDGRQFVIDLMDVAKTVLTQLTEGK
jgi:hypothetical protein